MTRIGTRSTRLRWNGAAVKAKVVAATIEGVDETMVASMVRARDDHPYDNRTNRMEQSVSIFRWAELTGPNRVSGSWGAHANYALYLEIGTSRPWSHAPRAEERAFMARGDMWAISPPQPLGTHTDTKWVTRAMPSTGLGGFMTPYASYRMKIPGSGPLMDPRMSLRPAAAREYPLLATRIRAKYMEL